MKSSRLILLIIFVAFNTMNVEKVIKIGSPYIEFEKNTDLPNNSVYVYSIQLKSHEELLQFEIIPSIQGENLDCEINHLFDDNTHRATLNYFYVVPKHLETDEIILTFKLTDKKESNVKTEIIKLYNSVDNLANRDEQKITKREI